MSSGRADFTVEIIDANGDPDHTVAVIDGISGLSPSVGDLLVFDGTAWVDRALVDGDIPAAITRDAEAAAAYVAKATLDANSVLYAVTDDIPAALALAASTVVGRAATGNAVALTVAQLQLLLNTSGIVRPMHGSNFSTVPQVPGAANRCWYYRVEDAGSISKVRVYVGTQSGNICVAAYTNSGTGPTAVPTGGRLATSGSIACPASGVAEISLGATITANVGDWIGIALDNNTASLYGTAGAGGPGAISGTIGFQDTAFPCPATPSVTKDNSIRWDLAGVA